MDIHELVRLKRAELNNSQIGRKLGYDRKTVRRYVTWAAEQGLLEGPLLSVEAMNGLLRATLPQRQPPQQVSSVAPYGDEIKELRGRNMEIAAITARLEERHGKLVSYEAVRRFVHNVDGAEPPEVFVRVEVEPGTEAQVDFGYAGLTLDENGALRKTWVFVMVLSWSRYMFACLVYQQDVATWLDCHRRAFDFFGGTPDRVVLDNLKAAILKASVNEPLVQRSYRELAQHYGFMIDPNPPVSPHLKGKVEKGGVHYVKRNFLAGRDREPTVELNRKLLAWCVDVAGVRTHGTTKQVPLDRFLEVEQGLLRPLPATPYDMAVWAEARLQRDCHLTFDRSYYSAPYRLVDNTLRIRGGIRTVRIYTTHYELVATHDRATEPGQRITCLEHLPPEKVPGLTISRDNCRQRAKAIGPATTAVVEALLESRPVDKLRVAGRVVNLVGTYPAERLERACQRALAFDDPSYTTVKNILTNGLDSVPLEPVPVAPAPQQGRFAFARQAVEYASVLLGGQS